MGCCSSKAADPKSLEGEAADNGQPIDFKRSSSMYVTTKGGAIEDHTPPKLDSDGHLVPEEIQQRITASESVSTTTVGEDEKTNIEVMSSFDLDYLQQFAETAFIESSYSMLP